MADGNGGVDRRKMRLAAFVCALALAGCGDDEAPPATTPATSEPAQTTTATATATQAQQPQPQGEPTAPAETPPGDPRVNALERDAVRTVRDFVAALDARRGAAACELLAPDALAGFELPEPRGGCAASLTASIGYRDPRGFPVWEGATVAGMRVAEISADRAKVIATIITTFADRGEASVEDDVLYLDRTADRWLIAKPSSTLYRAVGIADIPPSVLAPPSG
jgi:hypothetical protein